MHHRRVRLAFADGMRSIVVHVGLIDVPGNEPQPRGSRAHGQSLPRWIESSAATATPRRARSGFQSRPSHWLATIEIALAGREQSIDQYSLPLELGLVQGNARLSLLAGEHEHESAFNRSGQSSVDVDRVTSRISPSLHIDMPENL